MKTTILKLGLALVAILAFSYGNAQQTTGDNSLDGGTTTTGAYEDVSQASVLNGTVRVIDNKGTKKFLQVKNGLTLLTDVTPDGGYVSTWQLGGTLTDETTIDVDGNVFAITGIAEETGTAATAFDGTGYTLVVRDETTGELKKILATDLIQSGQEAFTAADGQTAFPLTGAPVLPAFEQVYVYRNGAKLVAITDYTVAGSTVTLTPTAPAPNDWAVLAGDVIEVHFIK